MRILVIEDNPNNMSIIRKILNSMGYTVFEATDGLQGLDMIVELRPDVVVMDYHLPNMDGLEATRRIKETEHLCDIPIIALTADAYARQAFIEAGCDAYLSKPIRKAVLLRTITQVVSAQTIL